jgi:hypothetical protein
MCSGIMLKNKDTLGRIHDLHFSFHLYDLGKLPYWNPSHFFKVVKWLLKTKRTAVGIRSDNIQQIYSKILLTWMLPE